MSLNCSVLTFAISTIVVFLCIAFVGAQDDNCDVIVTPTESLQNIVSKVKKDGVVCLQPGTYNIEEPLIMDQDKVLKGKIDRKTPFNDKYSSILLLNIDSHDNGLIVRDNSKIDSVSFLIQKTGSTAIEVQTKGAQDRSEFTSCVFKAIPDSCETVVEQTLKSSNDSSIIQFSYCDFELDKVDQALKLHQYLLYSSTITKLNDAPPSSSTSTTSTSSALPLVESLNAGLIDKSSLRATLSTAPVIHATNHLALSNSGIFVADVAIDGTADIDAGGTTFGLVRQIIDGTPKFVKGVGMCFDQCQSFGPSELNVKNVSLSWWGDTSGPSPPGFGAEFNTVHDRDALISPIATSRASCHFKAVSTLKIVHDKENSQNGAQYFNLNDKDLSVEIVDDSVVDSSIPTIDRVLIHILNRDVQSINESSLVSVDNDDDGKKFVWKGAIEDIVSEHGKDALERTEFKVVVQPKTKTLSFGNIIQNFEASPMISITLKNKFNDEFNLYEQRNFVLEWETTGVISQIDIHFNCLDKDNESSDVCFNTLKTVNAADKSKTFDLYGILSIGHRFQIVLRDHDLVFVESASNEFDVIMDVNSDSSSAAKMEMMMWMSAVCLVLCSFLPFI